MATKKKEIFGIFRRGGFSSKVNFLDHFFETIKNYFENNLRAVMVGDSIVDAQFARNARIPFFSTGDISGYPQYGNFQDIADAILKESTNVE